MNDQSQTFRTSLLEENDGPGHNPTDNATMGELIAARFSRRGFLKGSLAVSAIAATVSPMALMLADDARAESKSAFTFEEVEVRYRRKAPCRCRLRCRCASPLGRCTLCRFARVRSAEPDAGKPRPSSSATTMIMSATFRSTVPPSMACSSSTTNTPMNI